MDEDSYAVYVLGLGAIILLVAWLPLALRKLPLSLPIICLLIGVALQATGALHMSPSILRTSTAAERLTEAVIIIALMGAGLRLDRPFGWRRWASTWRLLLIAMPLTICGMMLIGQSFLGLGWPAALLLGAALSPTDPVLAADVQTGPPGSGEKGEVRFALTSEAGLNDGLAFPFVMLALALAQVGTVSWGWWFTVDLIGKLVAAVVIGWAGGRAMGWVLFRLPDLSLSRTGDGLVALGVTLMAYATAQMLHAYGFVTVFAAAVAIRASAPNHAFHGAMAQFSDQVERMLLMLVLVVFGAATSAGLLQSLNWAQVVTGLALIFAVRPLSAWLAFAGSELTWQPKALIAFFGIRGIGTLYYLFYAFRHGAVTGQTAIWNVAGFTILVSILLHGTTSTPLMEWAARIRMRRH